MYIPLTKPYWGKKEEKAVIDALRLSNGAGDGIFSKKLVAKLSDYTGSKYILPVTSCTHGLELAMIGLGVKPGDEVIVPSFTMSSTANAVLLAGARPVFADIDAKTYCIDPIDIEKKITKKTRGIIVVSYAGMPVDYERILSLCRAYKLFLVEDAAHALGATWRKKPLGTIGDIGVYSFHGTKNISCGEGGVVVTNNAEVAKRMELYRANGTNRAAFLAGTVDKYSWVVKGTSYFLSDILASIVISQIDQMVTINKKRTQIASKYTKELKKYSNILQVPSNPPDTEPNWHIYAIKFNKTKHRDTFLQTMRAKGIDVSYHYVPLHSSQMGKTLYTKQPTLPATDDVASTLIRLPLYPGLTKKEIKYVITSAQRVLRTLI